MFKQSIKDLLGHLKLWPIEISTIDHKQNFTNGKCNLPFSHVCLTKVGGNSWFLLLLFWVTYLPALLSSFLKMHENYSETALNLCAALRSNGMKRLGVIEMWGSFPSLERRKGEVGREMFKCLQYCHLPGTLASVKQRRKWSWKKQNKTKPSKHTKKCWLEYTGIKQAHCLELGHTWGDRPPGLSGPLCATLWKIKQNKTEKYLGCGGKEGLLMSDFQAWQYSPAKWSSQGLCVALPASIPAWPLNIVSFLEQPRHFIITSVPGLYPDVTVSRIKCFLLWNSLCTL